MTYRTRNILIAVALAGFAALLVTFYVSNYKSSVQHAQATVVVPVASHDIPVSTPGSQIIANGWLTTREIPRNAVVPGAISSPSQIKALVATQPTYQGEQITTERFGPLTQTGVAGQISGTQRAVQLTGNPNQVLAGILQPGDSVDFESVVTVHFTGDGTSGVSGSDLTFSRIVVRNVKVLQVQSSGTSGKITGGGTAANDAVLLRMTDAQSQKVMLGYSKGDYWTLELRPGLKSVDSANSVETAATVLVDGISRSVLSSIFAIAGGK